MKLSTKETLDVAVVAVSALHACGTGTKSPGVVEQEPVQAAQDAVSAKYKITGVAVTWNAEQIFFLPASRGTAHQKSGPFTSCRGKALRPSDASL